MRYNLLKSLLGKYICKSQYVRYCHIDRIIVIEGQRAIATAIVKTETRTLHWFLETSWETDNEGIHSIISCKILKEDELDGYTPQDEALQRDSERLRA